MKKRFIRLFALLLCAVMVLGMVPGQVGAVVLEGASAVLLSAFRDKPDALYYDFEDCGDEKLLDTVGITNR